MTLTEATIIRTAQLAGKPVPPAALAEAIAVIVASGKKRRARAYGTTPKSRRTTDNQQVKLLKDELRGVK